MGTLSVSKNSRRLEPGAHVKIFTTAGRRGKLVLRGISPVDPESPLVESRCGSPDAGDFRYLPAVTMGD
jgi:hypothetical protein